MRWLIDGHLDLAWNALSWERDISEVVGLEAVADHIDPSASLPAATGMPRSAAIWTAVSAPS
ncbi:MAG: hypothetical protein WA746_03910, partial [Isosphaeraceae bacterium]